MRGMTFGGDRTIEFIEIADPVPGPGDVVIEMKASGICGTDLHLYRGPKGQSLLGATSSGPVIRGHEPCGIVAAVGTAVPKHQAQIGDRVMVHHYWGCAACRHCRTGWPQMCERQRPVVYGSGAGHGGHAPYMKVPAGTLVPLPDQLSFSAGAAIACGTGTAYAALRRLGVRGGDSLAIFGQGPVGLAATQLAVAMGARVIALDLSQERLKLARDMDASGAADARHAALDSLRTWGTLALVGVGGTFSPNVGRYMQRQQTVFGSFTFSTVGQADCADFAVRRNVAIDRIFSDTWRLDEADAAYRKTDAQVAGKSVFLF
jgi:D-arabinose 1-dehydrogenase-like Zn-dependent alcohol dehydrogenase